MKRDLGDNARAALVAMVAASGGSVAGRQLCATLLDNAEAAILNAPAEVIEAAGGNADIVERMGGAALLTEICISCRLCRRGQAVALGGRGKGENAAIGPLGVLKQSAMRG